VSGITKKRGARKKMEIEEIAAENCGARRAHPSGGIPSDGFRRNPDKFGECAIMSFRIGESYETNGQQQGKSAGPGTGCEPRSEGSGLRHAIRS
jgi:hypothetical protein